MIEIKFKQCNHIYKFIEGKELMPWNKNKEIIRYAVKCKCISCNNYAVTHLTENEYSLCVYMNKKFGI
jgi:hypothetical protein